MTIRSAFHNGFQAAVKDGPTAPELAADAHDCIMVRSSKDRPNTRLWRDQRLIAGSPRISSPVPMPLYTDAKRACEDEVRELRRQAILGMAHYRSARAFAVNPARLTARPCGLRGLTAQRGQAKRSLHAKNARERPGKIEQADRRAWGNFTLDKESPIQGEEPAASGLSAGAGSVWLSKVKSVANGCTWKAVAAFANCGRAVA